MLCWYIHTVFSFAKFWLFLTLIVISTHKKTKQENKYFVWFWCMYNCLENIYAWIFEREWNEKNVRENPTKLEYILRCFLKVKAICKIKKMLRLRRRRECALKKLFVLLILEHMMNKCFNVKLKKNLYFFVVFYSNSIFILSF